MEKDKEALTEYERHQIRLNNLRNSAIRSVRQFNVEHYEFAKKYHPFDYKPNGLQLVSQPIELCL